MYRTHNKDIIEKYNGNKSCIYLIDTGIVENGKSVYKFGRTGNLHQRMANHMSGWPNMRIVHIQRVKNMGICEKHLKEMCRDFRYGGCLEMLHATSPHYFVTCMKEIHLAEKSNILGESTRVTRPSVKEYDLLNDKYIAMCSTVDNLVQHNKTLKDKLIRQRKIIAQLNQSINLLSDL